MPTIHTHRYRYIPFPSLSLPPPIQLILDRCRECGLAASWNAKDATEDALFWSCF
jgi:hypothetical protein